MEETKMVQGLSDRLIKERLNKNLSQKDVADFLNLSPSIISNYERGERTPSIEVLISLSNLYRCSVDYLLGIDKNKIDYIDTSMLNDKQKLLLQSFLDSLKC